MKSIKISSGKPVVIPKHLKEEAEKRFKEHQFSIIANEMMSMNRSMPDVRYPEWEFNEFLKFWNSQTFPKATSYILLQVHKSSLSKEAPTSIDNNRLSQWGMVNINPDSLECDHTITKGVIEGNNFSGWLQWKRLLGTTAARIREEIPCSGDSGEDIKSCWVDSSAFIGC